MKAISKQFKSFILIFLMGSGYLLSQTNPVTISFLPVFGNTSVKVGKNYALSMSDSVQIETFKFYLSSIELLHSDRSIWKESNSFHLVDISNPATCKLNIEIPTELKYNQIRFNLGIDSITNVSGAMGGDLDPTKGMYWTWQSGYINLKLEGRSALCNTMHNEFQFHLGGYQSPFSSLQTIQLDLPDVKSIIIQMDLEKFFKNIDLSKQNQLMSPSLEAFYLSRLMRQTFKVQHR